MSTIDTAAADRLAVDYQPLALRLAYRFHTRTATSVPLDELRSEALLALVTLARQFNPEAGCKFTSFIHQRLPWYLCDFVAAWKRSVGALSLSQIGGEDDGRPGAEPADHRGGGIDQIDGEDLLQTLQTKLRPRWVDVLTAYYGEENTLEEVGQRYGVTKEAVRLMLGRAALRENGRLRENPPA